MLASHSTVKHQKEVDKLKAEIERLKDRIARLATRLVKAGVPAGLVRYAEYAAEDKR